MPRNQALLLALVTLAGCATATPSVVPKKPAATATAAAKAAPVLPGHVHLPMPASLKGLMGGERADGLIASGGGNIISHDSGTIISHDSGTYRLDQAASAAASCGPPWTTAQAYFEEVMQLSLVPYAESVLIVNRVLGQAIAAGLAPGAPQTIDDPRDDRAGAKLTVVLEALPAGGSVLRAAEGTSYVEADQILAVQFGSATQGTAVYRSNTLHPSLGHLAIATHFDLDAGIVEADGLADPTVLPAATDPTLYRAHWSFRAPKAGPAFTMRLAAYTDRQDQPCENGQRGVAANFLADGSAAVRMGRVLPGERQLSYTRADGDGYDAVASHDDDFFLAADGTKLTSKPPDPLLALVPAAADFNTDFPADPGVGAPFADPVFAFP